MIFSVCQPMIDIRYIINNNFLKTNNLESNGYTEVNKKNNKEHVNMSQDTNNIECNDKNLCEFENQKIINALNKNTNESRVLMGIKNLPEPKCKMAGGSCLNTLRMIAQKSKIAVTFIGAIGNDQAGNELLQIFEKDRMTYCLEKIPDVNTANCQVFLCNNERSLVTDLGAANKLTVKHLQTCANVINDAKLIYLCAFFADSMSENALYVLHRLKAEQTLIFNISNQDIILAIDYDLLEAIINRSDVIIGNKEEFYALYKRMARFENKKIQEDFLSYFAYKKFICTDGKNKISYCEQKNIQTVDVEKLNREELDTCGAGDFFAAGVIDCLYNGNFFDIAIKQGKEWAKEYILVNSKQLKY